MNNEFEEVGTQDGVHEENVWHIYVIKPKKP